MIKHIGRHNNEKIVIMYREVPDEAHMALIVYSTKLPANIHDPLMAILEDPIGQNAENLADAAFRQTMPDGRNLLNAIHKAGYMKKVPTNQVIVTPTAHSNCRLDELNSILNEMSQGKDATNRLAELDANQGIRDPNKAIQKPAESVNTSSADINGTSAPVATDGVLTDAVIAATQRDQAARMRTDAEQLITEAARLEKEADALAPGDKKNARKTTKKATSKKRATKKATA